MMMMMMVVVVVVVIKMMHHRHHRHRHRHHRRHHRRHHHLHHQLRIIGPRATPKMDDTSHTCDLNRCPNKTSLNHGVRWWKSFQITGVTSLSSCFFH